MSKENHEVSVSFCTGRDVASAGGRQSLPDADPWPNHAVLGSVLAALLCVVSSGVQARTINAASPSLTDVRRAIAAAVHGDTVIVPAGTAAWNSSLAITKAVTIQGETTTDISNGTANDRTILTDQLPRPGEGYFAVRTSSGTLVRITGITFSGQGGIQTNLPNGAVRVTGSTTFRIDHCHFTHLNHSVMVGIYSANFGVADHNVFDDFVAVNQSFYINMPDYGDYQNGDGAFAEPAGYGGPKFFFIEDNYIFTTPFKGGAVDSFFGAKYVFRYNRVWDTVTLGHSTGMTWQRGRGVRAQEVYNNEWHFTTARDLDGTTGGSMLAHNNRFYGALVRGWHLQVYRAFWSYGAPFYGADGANPWDSNNPHGLYDSGTLTSAAFPNLTDSTKNWTTNQWRGYAVRRPSDRAMGLIVANTHNTLTIAQYLPINFAAGNQYQIHKALRVLDQPGTGRGDRITGDPPVNTRTGTAEWPNPDTEPCYSWNNVHSPGGEHLNFVPSPGAFTILHGRDFYNDTPMPGYTPYVYPHPLTTGVQPPANATRGSQRSLNKNKERKAKKIKRWKWGKVKENSANEATERVVPEH